MTLKHIGAAFRHYRKRAAMKPMYLALKSGYSVTTIMRLETGRGASWNTMFTLADALGVRFSEIIAHAEQCTASEELSGRFCGDRRIGH